MYLCCLSKLTLIKPEAGGQQHWLAGRKISVWLLPKILPTPFLASQLPPYNSFMGYILNLDGKKWLLWLVVIWWLGMQISDLMQDPGSDIKS